jgi:biotin carboxylase
MPMAFESLGCERVQIDFRDPESACDSLAESPIDGVIPTDEGSAVVAAMIAARLGLPAPSVAAVQAARDKRRMRQLLCEADVPSPAFRVLEPDRDPTELGREVSFPCVVKAPMLSGSQGVIRADDRPELVRAVSRVRSILAHHPSPARDDPDFHRILVEDYLEGVEVAVEALISGGEILPIAIFDKPDELVGPFFEETLYVTPSRLPPAMQAEVIDVARRAAQALGLGHGPIHAELRIGPGGPFVVEIAARSIGGLCSRTLELALRDLEGDLIAHAAGLAPKPRDGSTAAGVMMIPIAKSGVFRRVSGVEEASKIEGIDSVTITARPGDAVRALPEGSSYLGFIFARGEIPRAVEASLREANSLLTFELSRLL